MFFPLRFVFFDFSPTEVLQEIHDTVHSLGVRPVSGLCLDYLPDGTTVDDKASRGLCSVISHVLSNEPGAFFVGR